MRTIAHISDIHFGRIDYAVVKKLKESISAQNPSVVVVSGDLTQRARSAQFIEARTFLDTLPKPQIVVPGNHDISLHNLFARFVRPLDKYRKYITDDLEPFHSDEELAVLGVNTARSLTIKDGRINEGQIEKIRHRMCSLGDHVLKVIVTHHPFDLPEGSKERDIVGRAGLVMERISDCGADLFLAGHMHQSHIGTTATRYKTDKGRSALVVQAGTATSTRGRGEANSYNLIEFEHPRLTVKRFECVRSDKGFFEADRRQFVQIETGWEAAV
jgi:3',5'-cyclic AMP phosphodiesterase CpdA